MNSIDKVSFAGENYINNTAVEHEIENTFAKFNSAWFDGNLKSVQLEVFGKAMLYLQRNFPTQATLLQESDSKLIIKLEYYNSSEVISFVKRWLPEIKIINNEALKEKIKDILLKSLDNL